MMKLGKSSLFRLFIVSSGMFKAGYAIMILQSIYFSINTTYQSSYLYYKYFGAFIIGMVIPLILIFNIRRVSLMILAELIFLFTVIPSTDNCVRIYGFLVGGGLCFIFYPIYAREHFLQSQQFKVMTFIWSFSVLGIGYYICMQWKFFNFSYFPLIERDSITPYVFLGLSIINLAMMAFNKKRDSFYFYSLQQQEDLSLYWLISSMFKFNTMQILSEKFCKFEQPDLSEQYQTLVVQESWELLSSRSETTIIVNSKLLNEALDKNIFVFIVGFCSGVSGIFYSTIQTLMSFIILIADEGQIDQPNNNCTIYAYQYFLFLMVLLYCLICAKQFFSHQNKRIYAISYFSLSFFFSVVLLIGVSTNNENNRVQIFFNVLLGVCQLAMLAPIIFSLPFVYLKINKIIIFFVLMLIGSLINKAFINNSEYLDEHNEVQQNYNKYISSTIATFFGLVSFYKITEM